MTASDIQLDIEGAVATIAIDRPGIRNALDAPSRAAMRDAFAAAGSNDAVRAVILTGMGKQAFCAGQDVKELITFDGDGAVRWVEDMQSLFACVRGFEKPVVGAINGVAAGLGFQLALMTDIRIAGTSTRMGQTEINLGLASMSGPWIMREIMGLAHTIEMTLTARLADADDCLRLGLVNEVVGDDEISTRAREVAQELAQKPPLAVAHTKRRFWKFLEPGFNEAMAAAAEAHRSAFESGEPQKVLRAFLDKASRQA